MYNLEENMSDIIHTNNLKIERPSFVEPMENCVNNHKKFTENLEHENEKTYNQYFKKTLTKNGILCKVNDKEFLITQENINKINKILNVEIKNYEELSEQYENQLHKDIEDLVGKSKIEDIFKSELLSNYLPAYYYCIDYTFQITRKKHEIDNNIQASKETLDIQRWKKIKYFSSNRSTKDLINFTTYDLENQTRYLEDIIKKIKELNGCMFEDIFKKIKEYIKYSRIILLLKINEPILSQNLVK